MILLRTHIGSALRAARIEQGRTLRDVAKSARVSLGYLSEVERGNAQLWLFCLLLYKKANSFS